MDFSNGVEYNLSGTNELSYEEFQTFKEYMSQLDPMHYPHTGDILNLSENVTVVVTERTDTVWSSPVNIHIIISPHYTSRH